MVLECNTMFVIYKQSLNAPCNRAGHSSDHCSQAGVSHLVQQESNQSSVRDEERVWFEGTGIICLWGQN